ncbi:hypothetical protein, partial [Sinorhizobium saheli]|uniref:hypothetical protein n=1 Tax=Sinorhizobium saheli TaxID=36856 RepID=UPI001AEEEA4B
MHDLIATVLIYIACDLIGKIEKAATLILERSTSMTEVQARTVVNDLSRREMLAGAMMPEGMRSRASST